jgi:hypothetical protein
MPTHSQQPRNPWAQDNPSNYDMLMMRTQQNVSTGMPRNEAEARAAQEILAVQKAGGHPMGMINETEATNNEIEGSRGAHQMEQQRQLKRQNYNMYSDTRADGLSFGDFMNKKYAAQQSQQAQQQAQQLARDKEMGRMYGESILGNGMNELRNMRLADDVQGFQPPTIKLQGK